MKTLDARLAAAGFPDEPPGGLEHWRGPRPSMHLLALRVFLGGDFPPWLGQLPLAVEMRVRIDVTDLGSALLEDSLPGQAALSHDGLPR